jgi:SAM-dependent methyltransferase
MINFAVASQKKCLFRHKNDVFLLVAIFQSVQSLFKMFQFITLLKFRPLRYLLIRFRYALLKNRMRFHQGGSASIGEQTIKYNLSAFDVGAGFGCGQRMGLLIYPLVAYNSFYKIDKGSKKVLMVGCRTEDDIYWMRAYGFSQTLGFDLFSYSDRVLVGDIHKTDFEDESFDILILGWMISYTKDPAQVFKECRRILKPGGLFGVGIEHNPAQDNNNIQAPRVNTLNSTKDLIGLMNDTMKHKVFFEYDHENENVGDFSTAVVTIVR